MLRGACWKKIVSTLNINVGLLTGQFSVDMSARSAGGQSSFGTANFPSTLPASRGPVGADNSASLVAASANINLGDIKDGVSLAFVICPFQQRQMISLVWFQGFPAIPDSVRIHYIDTNRCSGDAMITLVSNERAKVAIRQLSGKQCLAGKLKCFCCKIGDMSILCAACGKTLYLVLTNIASF